MNQRHRLIFFGFPTPFFLKEKDSGCPGAQLYPLLSTARIMSESWRGCGDHSALNLTDGGQTWNCGTERRVKPLLLASPIASIQTSMCTVFCMSDINLYCRRFTFWKVTSKLANGVSRFQVFVKLHYFRLHIAKALHHRCHLWLPLPTFPPVPVFPRSGLVLLASLAESMVASCPMGCGHLESSYGLSVEWQQRWCKIFQYDPDVCAETIPACTLCAWRVKLTNFL